MDPHVTWIELLCLCVLVVFAAAILPPLRTRRLALTVVQRLVQLAALLAVVGCGVFLVWPGAAPEFLTTLLRPVSDYLEHTLGEHFRPLAWLAAAAAVVIIASPLAIAIGFIRKLDTMGALLRRVAGVLRNSAANTLGASPGIWTGVDELDEAVQSMATTANERPKQARRRKLAEMFLDK